MLVHHAKGDTCIPIEARRIAALTSDTTNPLLGLGFDEPEPFPDGPMLA